MRVARIVTAVVCSCLPATTGVGQQVTIGSLADELADRDAVTFFPSGQTSYELAQASSHDPRNAQGLSRLGAPWGSLNTDFGNYLRKEVNQGRNELVLFEDTGPGVITRWWTTAISGGLLNSGNLRVYVDGASQPTLTQSGAGLVGGDNIGFGSSLNFGTPDLGGNLYGPLPYSSGVKVTWDGPTTHGSAANVAEFVANGGANNSVDNAVWYNINYRKYAPGTPVEAFTGGSTAAYARQLAFANERLASDDVHGHVGATLSLEGESLATSGSLTRNFSAPGGDNAGGAIREIKLKFNGGTPAEQRAALEQTFVELTFDGRLTARVPAGQFFGNGWSENATNVYNAGRDYYRSVTADGTMSSRWVMPYQDEAQVRLINLSPQTVNLDLEVSTGDYDWTDGSMHFFADYRAEEDIRTRTKPGSPWPGSAANRELYSAEGDGDFRFINIRGQGVYVGDTMSIRNLSNGPGLNNWWGEGDEKIYIDYLDENGRGHNATPAHLGTGTEDYYGYSFGSATPFESAFVTQPTASGQNDTSGTGVTINGRVRGLDAIPFDESLKFDMEVWKWRQGELDLGAATFWYGRPGAVSLETVANLGADFRAGLNEGDAASGISDASGDGEWNYYSSMTADPSDAAAELQPLTWGTVGDASNQGYGGGENDGFNLAAVSDQFLFSDGDENLGTQGAPGYHELALHPGGDDLPGEASREYVVARWTSGDSVDGLINIAGAIRNLVDGGDSVDFYIYVNGELEFSADGADGLLSDTAFDFDTSIVSGQSVDLVLGNGGAGSAGGDETLLRAVISADFPTPLRILGDLDGDGTVGVGDWQFLRDNYGTPLADLNDDGTTDAADFRILKGVFIATHGESAFASLLNVPEPTAASLVSCLIALRALAGPQMW